MHIIKMHHTSNNNNNNNNAYNEPYLFFTIEILNIIFIFFVV